MTKSIFPPWDFSSWTDVDDRVRGGSSTSHLEPVHLKAPSGSALSDKPTGAKFFGHLDIDTLGGAGFASQRYRFGPEPLHLPRTTYKGVTLTIHPSSSASHTPSPSSSPRANTFTLVLKTSLNTRPPSRPKTPPQPDPASLSYEASFTPSKQAKDAAEVVHLAFDDFKVTYRGREVPKDDPRWQPFHSEKIYELSLMCRSDFGGQKGDFEVVVGDIAGWKKGGDAVAAAGADDASHWRVVSWARSVWGTLTAIVVGFWIWAKGAADGKIALPDEEKDPLI